MKSRILLLMFWMLSLSACNGSGWNGDEWVKSSETAKAVALTSIPKVPYGQDQQGAFKAYFDRFDSLLQLLEEEESASGVLNDYLSKQDMEKVCTRVFMSPDSWSDLVAKCQKNHFFLCAESVKRFAENVKALWGTMNAENQKRFEATSCRLLLQPR